jgi:cobalt-zinc-cadmium efflux system protein
MVDHSAHTAIKPTAENERALKISGWLTGIYFLIELGIGITSRPRGDQAP